MSEENKDSDQLDNTPDEDLSTGEKSRRDSLESQSEEAQKNSEPENLIDLDDSLDDEINQMNETERKQHCKI